MPYLAYKNKWKASMFIFLTAKFPKPPGIYYFVIELPGYCKFWEKALQLIRFEGGKKKKFKEIKGTFGGNFLSLNLIYFFFSGPKKKKKNQSNDLLFYICNSILHPENVNLHLTFSSRLNPRRIKIGSILCF